MRPRHLESRAGPRRRPTAEYAAWMRMWSRVRGSANADAARNYRDRGVTVCERWRTYEHFKADMGPRPVGAWLDRIDNSRGYEPSNCRWTTARDQQRNRRGNRLITFNGETQCLAAWAERFGLHPKCVQSRLNAGWSIQQALATPSRGSKEEIQ